MSQVYSNPKRTSDPYSLPDVETFYLSAQDFISSDKDSTFYDMLKNAWNSGQRAFDISGWYYWYCFLGCLPDSDPIGPFDTEEEAIADAQENAE